MVKGPTTTFAPAVGPVMVRRTEAPATGAVLTPRTVAVMRDAVPRKMSELPSGAAKVTVGATQLTAKQQ